MLEFDLVVGILGASKLFEYNTSSIILVRYHTYGKSPKDKNLKRKFSLFLSLLRRRVLYRYTCK